MFRNGKPDKVYKVNFLLNSGGLGDSIARLPVMKYVIENHPEVIPQIWVPDYIYDLVRRSLPKLHKDKMRIFKFSDKARYQEKLPGRISDGGIHTNLSSHMTDHAFHMLINKQVDNKYKDSLPVDVSDVDISQFNLPEDYVVITTGFTANVRQFLPDTVNPIIDYVISKGYTPVFLGKTETENGAGYTIKGAFSNEIEYQKGIDLVDKTSLLETTKIIYGSKAIVGMDNGLLHIATTHPDLPVIGGFTSVNPVHRMAYRHGGILGYNYYPVVPPPELDCRFCQSNMVFAFDHPSFTECYYDVEARGKEIACLNLMTSQLFIEQLEKIL